MQIPKWIKRLVETHPEFFEEDQLGSIYKRIQDRTKYPLFATAELSEFLIGADIDPLQYLDFDIPANTFLGVSLLKKDITFNDLVQKLGQSAFERSNVEQVNTNNVTTLAESCFKSCENLTEITMPKVRDLRAYCFSGCTSLQKVLWGELSDSGYISSQAFAGCSSLKQLEIPEGIYYLGSEILADSGIETLYLPDTLEDVGSRFLGKTPNLKSVYYGGTVQQWQSINNIRGFKSSTIVVIHCIDGDYDISPKNQ